jgi:hypothetical protein
MSQPVAKRTNPSSAKVPDPPAPASRPIRKAAQEAQKLITYHENRRLEAKRNNTPFQDEYGSSGEDDSTFVPSESEEEEEWDSEDDVSVAEDDKSV